MAAKMIIKMAAVTILFSFYELGNSTICGLHRVLAEILKFEQKSNMAAKMAATIILFYFVELEMLSLYSLPMKTHD